MYSSPLQALARKICKEGPIRIQSASGRRVRIQLNGHFIVDTTRAMHVWEKPQYPYFYVPATDIHGRVLGDSMLAAEVRDELNQEILQAAIYRHPKVVKDGEKNCAFVWFSDSQRCPELNGLVRFDFNEMGMIHPSPRISESDMTDTKPDQWYEEDTPIYVHPKDPTKRIDILPSSRPLEVRVDGYLVAKAAHCFHLIEPMLPVRYYVPPSFVDASMLRESSLKTRCPYKGEAEYRHLMLPSGRMYENIIWFYRYPTNESIMIAGCFCFYNEKAEIWLDGQKINSMPPATI
jgi:uncharacterized protein (DUF427 family)